jgi:RNA polymerase sigma factor (sigma-70 family)
MYGENMPYEKLLDKLSLVLKRITYKLSRQFLSFSAQDLFQEASLHLWQDFIEGKLNDKTDSYILQGCYFYLKNYIRKENLRYKLLSLEEACAGEGANLEYFLEDEKAAGFFDSLNAKMVAENIRSNGLTSREKDILFLYADGLTTRDIGRRLGLSHVSIVKAMGKIREKCKKHVDEI